MGGFSFSLKPKHQPRDDSNDARKRAEAAAIAAGEDPDHVDVIQYLHEEGQKYKLEKQQNAKAKTVVDTEQVGVFDFLKEDNAQQEVTKDMVKETGANKGAVNEKNLSFLTTAGVPGADKVAVKEKATKKVKDKSNKVVCDEGELDWSDGSFDDCTETAAAKDNAGTDNDKIVGYNLKTTANENTTVTDDKFAPQNNKVGTNDAKVDNVQQNVKDSKNEDTVTKNKKHHKSMSFMDFIKGRKKKD